MEVSMVETSDATANSCFAVPRITYLIFIGAADNIKIQVNAALINNSQAF